MDAVILCKNSKMDGSNDEIATLLHPVDMPHDKQSGLLLHAILEVTPVNI
jgi:hypothetical protein